MQLKGTLERNLKVAATKAKEAKERIPKDVASNKRNLKVAATIFE